MRSKVSELMDGELTNEHAVAIITQLKQQENLQDDWNNYHLIGDTMRQSQSVSVDISQRISRELASDPVILAPDAARPLKLFKRRIIAASIAASLMVMAVGWLGMQSLHSPQPALIADGTGIKDQRLAAPAVSVALSHGHPLAPAEINSYLFVHGEFSPGTATRGLTNYYVRPILTSQEAYRR